MSGWRRFVSWMTTAESRNAIRSIPMDLHAVWRGFALPMAGTWR